MKKLYALTAVLFFAGAAIAQKKFIEPVKILSGHTNDVNQVTVSPKGNVIATGSWDKNINIYDSSYKLLKTLSGHLFPITALRFRNDGKMLASGSSDNAINLWDSVYKKTRSLEGHHGQINALMFDRTNRYLFSGSEDHFIIAWDVNSGKSFRKIDNRHAVNALAQTSDPRTLYVADASPQIKVYNLANSQVAKTLDGHTDVVNAIAISNNNQLLISGSNDKTARIWNLQTGKHLYTLQVNCWKVTAVAISDDSRYALTGCNDGSVKIWELATGKIIAEIDGKGNYVKDVAFSKNKLNVLVASMLRGTTDYGLRVWMSGIEPVKTPLSKTLTDSSNRASVIVPVTGEDSVKTNVKVQTKKIPAAVKK